MLFGDKEIDFIELLQDLDYSEIYIPNNSDFVKTVLESIHNPKIWNECWINSSGKSDPPPDFYSEKYMLMMDVMRVNDHERKGKKGKLYNPDMAHERELYKHLLESGNLQQFPNAKVYLNGYTQLPTNKDHTYKMYKNNFLRVIKKHIESIPLYQKNHIGYKTVFFVFDESSAYVQLSDRYKADKQYKAGQKFEGVPHLFFLDEEFLNAFRKKKIDYLFWMAPYKFIQTLTGTYDLPKLIIFDLSFDYTNSIVYNENKMISVEI